MKSIFDKAASALGIVALSPVFATVSIANAVHYRSSPFYLVDRLGKDGKSFKIIKFKSMTDAVDKNGNLLPDELRRDNWGRFLRATSIDELPQLVNILKGEMSFVGPRPRGVDGDLYDVIPKGYEDILSVKPGLAGPWQVAAIGRKTRIPASTRIELDASYVREERSFLKDMGYLLRSTAAVIKGHDGEYLGRKVSSKSPVLENSEMSHEAG